MKRYLVLLSFVTIAGCMLAQEVKFEAYAPGLVAVGEQFRLTFTINKRPSNFNPPPINDFEVLAGPSTSSSSSIEMINGRVTQSESYTYTYILEATKEGKFTIEPAEATVSKDKIRSNPITIEVVKQAASNPQQHQGQGQRQPQAAENRSDLPNDDLFVTIDLSRRSTYIGEPIIATVKVYTRVNIANFEDAKFPVFNGFWSQEIETPNNINFQRVNLNGKIYNYGVIRKYLLFPQKSDKLEIDPFELTVVYQARANRPQSLFDEFFGSYQTYRKKLQSKPIAVTVKELPGNAPESFKGAVGHFKMDATIDKSSLKTNDALTVKVKITGSGNIRLIGAPKVEFPAGFEQFDPKTSENINSTSENAVGSKSYEFVAIPRTPGEFTIPPVEFTYFDPDKRQYVTVKSKEFALSITPDGNDSGRVLVTGYGKEDIKFIGKDIRFIKTEPAKLRLQHSFLFGSALYFTLIVLAILLFGAFVVLFGKRRREMSNIALIKNRKANRVAQKRLQVAEKHLRADSKAQFFEEVHKGIWGYLSATRIIPYANLTSDSAREELAKRGIENADIEELMRIIGVCEYARFAPKAEHSEMDSLYQSAHRLISKLEQAIRK